VEKIELQHIDPEPEATELAVDRYTFVFRKPAPKQEAAITFRIEPDTYGVVPVRLGLTDGPELAFRQFVFP
jgi:hypothetical protein